MTKLLFVSRTYAFKPKSNGVLINVDLVDWFAVPKFNKVPLLKLFFDSLLIPLSNFYLFDIKVLGVALFSLVAFEMLDLTLNGLFCNTLTPLLKEFC